MRVGTRKWLKWEVYDVERIVGPDHLQCRRYILTIFGKHIFDIIVTPQYPMSWRDK